MLVVFYIISAAAGVMASTFFEKRNLKQWLIATIIAILFGIAFCVPMTKKIIMDLSHPNFWSIFSVLSLIAWQSAFIFNNKRNLFDYEFSFLLLSSFICIFCSSIFYSDYLVGCNTEHVTTEIVSIVTTIDGTKSGESILEDGFVVERIFDINSNQCFYQYYIQLENGNIVPRQILEHSVTIIPIADTESPYVEIITTRACLGYRRETLEHVLSYSNKTYILYIPADSVKSVLHSN